MGIISVTIHQLGSELRVSQEHPLRSHALVQLPNLYNLDSDAMFSTTLTRSSRCRRFSFSLLLLLQLSLLAFHYLLDPLYFRCLVLAAPDIIHLVGRLNHSDVVNDDLLAMPSDLHVATAIVS